MNAWTDKPLRFPSTFDVQQLLSNFLENPTEDSELKKRTLNLIDALMQHEHGLNLIEVIQTKRQPTYNNIAE